MIKIIGETAEELSSIQTLIEDGLLSNKSLVVNVTYKMASGENLLVDKYNHIVGSKVESEEICDT